MDDLIEMFSDVDVAHPASNGEASNRPASFPVSQPICAEFEPSISTLHANPAPGRRSLTSQDNSPTYPLITVDHGNEASSSRLGDFFVVGEEPRVCYSDRELLDISRHLNLCGRQAWCRAPRLYTVLRIIGELKSLDAIIDQGISDIWFPFTASSVPTILSPSMRIKFIEAQPLVLTKAVDLEKDNRKNHTHFSRDETFPFEVRGKLGSGRYGTVDRVFSPFSRREFARKRFVRLKGTGSKDEIQSFKTELNILKKIRHPHCIELIASYTDTKYFGLIMSPVADCTLSSFYRLALEDLANANLLRGFYGCLANALGYLHDSKIRHRDIKPQNILVKGGIVLLADFGISLQWENLSRATTTEDSAKSWIYCAPEAAEYQARNCSSDIWSLGCVFLEMGTVLKGESIDAMRGFFQQRTGSYMFYQNISTIQEWSLLLQRQGSTCDNAPIEWALPMLHGSAQSRPHANELYAKISIFRQKTTAGTVVYAGTCCAADGGTDSAFDSAFDGDLWAEDRDDDIKSPPTTDDSLQPSTKAELVAETALRVRKDSDQSLANLLAVPSKDVEMEISIMVPSFLDSVKASNFPSTALIDNASLLGLAESSKRIQESDSQVDTKFDRAALATESEKLSLTSDIEATTRSISPIIADMTDSSSAKIPLVVPNTTSNAHCTESIDAARTYELTQTTQNSPIHFPCWCLAIGSFQGTSRSAEHLKFTMGDLVECLSAEDGVWWIGRLRHETGLVHSNSLQVLENISAPLITKAWPPFPTVGRLPWLDSQSWSTPSRFLRDVKADDAFMNIVKSRNADLYKLIELAAEKDIAALLQLLIGEGLDFKAKRVPEKKGRHSLIRGKRLGSKAKKVPEMKEDPPLLQELVNRQALSSACNLGSIWIAKYLLDHGMDVNGDEVTLDRWERPLGIAAAADQLEVSRLLISYGADPDGKVGWGYTPLIAASRNKSTKVLRFLLETQLRHIDFDYVAASGKCIAASGKYIRRNSLMFACYDDYLEGVELLLKYGANPNVEIIPYLSSWTPLTFACAAKSDLHCSEIVRLLIFYGAKVSTESGLLFAGVSSSTLAKRRGHNRAVHLLLAAEREQKAARLAYERQ